MRIVVHVDPSDFVTEEELDPLADALKAVAESHVGHLTQGFIIAIEVKR